MGIVRMKRGKQEEVKRLKAEQGIAEMEDPGINQAAGDFRLNMEGGKADEGQGDKPDVPDGPGGVPGAPAGGE